MGLDGVEIVMEVEQEFGVTLGDAEVAGVRTVGDLVELVASKAPTNAPGQPRSRTDIVETVRRIVGNQMGVEYQWMPMETRFIEDLGIL